jgi:hypothetical protein
MPAATVQFPATSGAVSAPFVVTNDYIYQPLESGINGSGRVAYTFLALHTGNYVIEATVNAPNDSANSLYVNIDAEPQDPGMIWDIPITSGFEQRTVNWRGNGTVTNNQFVPKVFTNLTQGSHQIIVRGREAGTQLQNLTVLQVP